MSFAQSFAEAHGIQTSIQKHKTDGMSGEASSSIRDGHDSPGTDHTHPIGEWVPRRTHIHPRTGSLTRKYAASPHGGGTEIGQKNLSGK